MVDEVNEGMDKKWLAGVAVLFLVLAYLFIGFAHQSGKMGSIVKELHGHPSKVGHRYHIVLIEQERYHPYWEMVEKGAAKAAERYGFDIEFTGTLIRKQKNRLGHEPMLLHITKSQFQLNSTKLKIAVEFESGLKKERVYELSFDSE